MRSLSVEIFDDWYSGGPEADDCWRDYERGRGHSYAEALKGFVGRHIFEFDKYHLNRSSGAILVMPCGRSGHLELGYIAGQGKPGWVLYPEEPERYDVMYQFATRGVFFSLELLKKDIREVFKLD